MATSTVDILIRTQAQLAGLQQAAAALNGVTRAAQNLITAGAVGTLIALTKQAINAADQMGKMAQKVGIVSNALSGFSYSAELSDISAGELRVSLKQLSESVTRATQGNKEAQQSFLDLKVAFQDASGNVKNIDGLMLELADAFQRMPDGIQKTTIATDLFGRSGQELIPFLNQGSAAIKEQIEEAKEFGLVIGPQFAQRAQDFNDNLTRMHAILRGIFLQLANALLPELIKFQEAILKFTKDTGAHVAVFQTLLDIYKEMASILRFLNGLIAAPAAFLGAFQGTFAATQDDVHAWDEAVKAFNASLDDTANRLERIRQIGLPKDETETGAPAGSGAKSRAQIRQEFEEKSRALDLQARTVQLRIEEARINQRLSPEQREKAIAEALDDQLAILERRSKLLSATAFTPEGEGTGVFTQPEFLEQFQKLNEARFELQRNFQEVSPGTTNTFIKRLDELQQRFGTVSQQMADAFESAFLSATDAVAGGIAGLIQGTLTWRQALVQVQSAIVTGIIQAIAQMAAKWIAARLAMMAKEVFASGIEAVARAPVALMESIKSYGVAALVGAAAFAAVMAAVGGFAQGGMIPGAPSSRDNRLAQVASGEYITRAAAVQHYGPQLFEALNNLQVPRTALANMNVSVPRMPRTAFAAGGLVTRIAAAAPAQNVSVAPSNAEVYILDSEEKLFRALESSRAARVIVRHVMANKTAIGIPA